MHVSPAITVDKLVKLQVMVFFFFFSKNQMLKACVVLYEVMVVIGSQV